MPDQRAYDRHPHTHVWQRYLTIHQVPWLECKVCRHPLQLEEVEAALASQGRIGELEAGLRQAVGALAICKDHIMKLTNGAWYWGAPPRRPTIWSDDVDSEVREPVDAAFAAAATLGIELEAPHA